ncbi:helix-turn-helix domain-containing protein [Methylobacterium nodulans]|uniref:Transcriptional regulator, XRE family n=1 Tax=Methylobacterium nodulans (strain LMG 21967 / CNCM I-2342 / ORS 2060) TaxID=460265 RepID=B8IAN7_METNO|nr:helix-turn-helix transcriptional regulator [Methylobacterium nodulans]ACL61082.1 transcriptional regulator, XRE family [Methylobacterium nodulans ORS 2060]
METPKKTRPGRKSHVRPEDVRAISARLRALRKTTGLSQEKFAARCGLGYKQWGNFEAEEGRIGIDAAIALVKEFGVTLDWIYLGHPYRMPAELLEQIRAAAEPEAAAGK